MTSKHQDHGKQFSWEDLIRSWPVEASHPLVDCPGDFQPEFLEFCRVDKFSKEDWYSGISAAAIFGSDYPTIWQHEYIDPSKLSAFTPRTMVVVGTCAGVSVWRLQGTVEELLQLAVFNSRNIGFLTRACGQTTRLSLTYVPIEKKSVYVYFVMTGPRSVDVRSFRGNPQTVTEVVTDVEQTWFICSAPGSTEVVDAPSSLKVMWLRRVCSQKKVDFLDPGYYLQNMSQYSAWSFETHSQQVSQVLKLLPRDSWIVAPGDGIGIVARLWDEKHVISGDFSRDPMTHKIVETESFTDTMDRGLVRAQQEKVRPVLFLSYVLSLFSTGEAVRAMQWDGPIIVIDNKDVSPGPQFSHIGPGVFVTGLEVQVKEMINEDFVPITKQLFSENLLSLEMITFIERNPSVNYWERMRPMELAKPYATKAGPLVIHSLSELVRYIDLGIDPRGAYLTSIGTYFVKLSSIYVDICTKLAPGQIYEIASTHPVIPVLKQYSHWADWDELFLFIVLRPCQVLRQKTSWKVVSIKPQDTIPVNSACRLLAHNQGVAYLATMAGNVAIPIVNEKVRFGLLLYLESFGHPSWKDVYASGSLTSKVGSEFVSVPTAIRQSYRENLSPRRFPWSKRIGGVNFEPWGPDYESL